LVDPPVRSRYSFTTRPSRAKDAWHAGTAPGEAAMTSELTLLLWSVALAFIEVVIAALAASSQVGLGTLAGNRETQPTLHGFAGRARRAHQNMMESLPLFIALVLIAQITKTANPTTLLGAELFFWGRLAHWLIYIAGLPWLRTLAWAVSVAGMILIFVELI
jgi:uncharacterized MAPEG superfamily protein